MPRGTQREALFQLAWAHAHETLLWASKSKGSRHTFNYDLINGPDPTSQVSSVWRIPSVPRREKSHGRHPTQKPLRLVRRGVLASTAEGDLIFDPFSGSGTTGVAAKELDRFIVGAETDRAFAELAARRIGATERGKYRGSLPISAPQTARSWARRKIMGHDQLELLPVVFGNFLAAVALMFLSVFALVVWVS